MNITNCWAAAGRLPRRHRQRDREQPSNVLKLYRMLEKTRNSSSITIPASARSGFPAGGTSSKSRSRACSASRSATASTTTSSTLIPGSSGTGARRSRLPVRLQPRRLHGAGPRRLHPYVRAARPEQLNLCGYALVAYKKSADAADLQIGENFRRLISAPAPQYSPRRRLGHGLFGDHAASGPLLPPSLQTLPYTRSNPSVRKLPPRHLDRRAPAPFPPQPLEGPAAVPARSRPKGRDRAAGHPPGAGSPESIPTSAAAIPRPRAPSRNIHCCG